MYARVSPVSGAENDLCPPTAQCRLVTTIVPVVAMILMWASPEPAIAGLCPVDLIEGVHRTEARELESAGFSAGSSCAAGSTSCWIGDRDYNARVISCNRSRDIDVIRFDPIKDIPFVHKPACKLLDERTAAERQFDADLDPRMITGKYRYLGAFKKWYGYLLERQGGEWVVTVTLDFQFPKQEEDKLHIPLYLMERLSDSAGGSTLEFGRCASYSTSDTVDGRIEVKGAGGVLVDRSCRIGRDDELFLAVPDTFLPATLGTTTSRPATEWLMLYFREVVDQTWNRPSNSFRLQTEIANL
ncbi:MAG: hypothetical protein MI919_10110, partial [Holophagales bacterium]|nr:hypothetical protein [Holophagales bacterium]